MTNDDSDLAFDRRTVLQLAGGSLATLGGVGTAAADTGEVIEPEVKEGSGTLAWITPEDPVSKGAEVTFSGKHSSDPEGEIEGYEWTVYHEGEEVATGTGETYSYTFEEVGDYEIFLLVDGPSGFAGSSWEWTIVDLENRKRPLPAVDFGGEQLVAITRDPDAKTELDAGGSYPPDGKSIEGYSWKIFPRQAGNSDEWFDFFDGEAPIYKFPFGGKYHIQLEVGTGEGQSTIRTFEKEVIGPNDRPPQVQVDWPVSDGASVSRGTELTFNVPRAVDPDGGDVDITWYYLGDQFDRLQSHDGPELTLTATDAGNIDVWVKVDDDEGQTWESEQRSITVEPGVLISVDGLPETVEAGNSVDTTINLDASDEVDIYSVTWDIYGPDGTQIDYQSREFAESFSYTTPTLTSPGEYEFELYVLETNDNGNGEPISSVTKTFSVEGRPSLGEGGVATVETSGSDDWTSVTFQDSLENPVVVPGPAQANGGHSSTVRGRNVTSDGFDVQIDEWAYLDGWHTEESVPWLAVEAGTHTVAGATLEAGTADVGSDFTSVSLSSEFSETPVVVSSCMSTNDTAPVTTRQQNVSTDSFDVRLQSEEAEGAHDTETVHYVAIEPTSGDGVQAGRTSGVTEKWSTISYDGFDSPPAVVASQQTFNGPNTATLRYRNRSAASAEVFVEEERSRDDEISHVGETVGWIAVNPGPIGNGVRPEVK